MRIPEIKDKKDLADRKRRLTALVKEAVKNAKDKGWVLARGSWNESADKGADIKGTVCAVGAIGLLKKPSLVAKAYFEPATVAPLVKNGCSDLTDDTVLDCLSHGFETGEPWDVSFNVYISYSDLENKYLAHAHKLGVRLGKRAPWFGDELFDRVPKAKRWLKGK